jgi:hypothetical protein
MPIASTTLAKGPINFMTREFSSTKTDVLTGRKADPRGLRYTLSNAAVDYGRANRRSTHRASPVMVGELMSTPGVRRERGAFRSV